MIRMMFGRDAVCCLVLRCVAVALAVRLRPQTKSKVTSVRMNAPL
jgi:hypothetical protein